MSATPTNLDHLPGNGTVSLDIGNPLTDPTGADLSLGQGALDSGPDNGASASSVNDVGTLGTVQLGLAGDVTSATAPDSRLAQSYYIASSKPVTVSFMPQSTGSDGSSSLTSSWTEPSAPGLFGDPGNGSTADGSAVADSFAHGSGGGSGGSGGGSVPPQYKVTGSDGITFVVNWDSSVANAPSGFVSGFETAINYFLNDLSGTGKPITITLDVGWGEVAGSRLPFGALGESATNIDQQSYSNIYSTAANASVFLPATDPLASTTHTYWVASAEEKTLGLIPDNTAVDGSVGFSSRVNWNYTNSPSSGQYDFVSTAEHEISETMGRIGLGGGSVAGVSNSYTAYDLFRYSAPGQLAMSGGSTAYFSPNDGASSGAINLAKSSTTNFNTIAGGDISDWASSAGNDAYNAFQNSGTKYSASSVDHIVMAALGYGTVTTA